MEQNTDMYLDHPQRKTYSEDGIEGDKTENKEKEVEYDQLLRAAGEFGLYQLFLFLKTGPFQVFAGFVYFTQLFMTEVPTNYWCLIPELGNMSAVDRRALAIPVDKDSPVGYSRCTSYVANWTEVVLTGHVPAELRETQTCQYGWEFNSTEIPYPTISSELGWVCEHDSYQAKAQSLFFVGSVLGGFIIGWVADRFGRIWAAVCANTIGCVAGTGSIFARNFQEFTICRVFMGMAHDNCSTMAYLLMLEYTASKYRSLLSNLCLAIFFTLGVVTLPWIALLCGHWKVLSLVTSVPLPLALLSPWLLPESPRWLVTRGRVDEVIGNVKAIARRNKKVVPDTLVARFRASCKKVKREESVTLLDLFKRPVLRKVFICICIQTLCCSIIFDTLVRTMGSLKFDFFLSFTLISLSEFPSLVVVSLVLDLVGRKWLAIISLMVCAVVSFTIPFVGGGLAAVGCAVLARFACNIAGTVVLQWSAELVPTPVRGSGTSVVHICGYLAAGVSPFIAYLGNYVSWLAFCIIGVIATSAAAICCYLPETAGEEMPQTFEDVETMMRNRTLWTMPCLRTKKAEPIEYTNNAFEMN